MHKKVCAIFFRIWRNIKWPLQITAAKFKIKECSIVNLKIKYILLKYMFTRTWFSKLLHSKTFNREMDSIIIRRTILLLVWWTVYLYSMFIIFVYLDLEINQWTSNSSLIDLESGNWIVDTRCYTKHRFIWWTCWLQHLE